MTDRLVKAEVDALAPRVYMALAEMGYPEADAYVAQMPNGTWDVLVNHSGPSKIPPAVIWMAFDVGAPDEVACWPCWEDGRRSARVFLTDGYHTPEAVQACLDGRCRNADKQRKPPRELLIPPQRQPTA